MAFKLSTHLYNHCRTSFLKCNQFDSHTALRAVFAVGDLVAYRNGLPEVVNKNDRVDSLLDYLLDQSFSDARPVIIVFIETLRDKFQPDQALFAELKALHQDIEQEFADVVDIPFVIAAMTTGEAQALFSEEVFDHPTIAPDERNKFHHFKQELFKHLPGEYVDRYSTKRDSWCPLIEQQRTISEIIWDSVADMNDQRQQVNSMAQIYRPKFVSAEFFSDDANVHQKIWDRLYHSGCVLIVDAISLFHPWIAKELDKSNVSSSDNVAMLVVSPINANDIPVNKIIEQEFSTRLEWAFMRFSTRMDTLCEFGVGDIRSLRRWIFSNLPETANIVQKQKLQPSNRDRIRQLMGEPQGVDQLIFGQGRVK
jgi:hypothetical protein